MNHASKISTPASRCSYYAAPWGCYAVVGAVSEEIALCRDGEGLFEKPFDEVRKDKSISQQQYLDDVRLQADRRFESSIRAWGEDLNK